MALFPNASFPKYFMQSMQKNWHRTIKRTFYNIIIDISK